MGSARIRGIALVLMLVLSGLHWSLLQCAAWTGMVIDYSRERGVATGLRETFDGDHPCAMCLAIRSARTDEHQQQNGTLSTPSAPLQPLGSPPGTAVAIMPVDNTFDFGPRAFARGQLLVAPPPVPPPRAVQS